MGKEWISIRSHDPKWKGQHATDSIKEGTQRRNSQSQFILQQWRNSSVKMKNSQRKKRARKYQSSSSSLSYSSSSSSSSNSSSSTTSSSAPGSKSSPLKDVTNKGANKKEPKTKGKKVKVTPPTPEETSKVP
ncbi:corepressor interacting with RBPJ 1-like [Microplitis demolitor]|uniref:corepressor interacting with RBPJ 1-like n=1 Tax=Microplitis demolitor TaxID=69319 RepID=UPI0004CD5CB3|nr:corepressor interacting with RBPJ 1-like [Microplitis demolitor]